MKDGGEFLDREPVAAAVGLQLPPDEGAIAYTNRYEIKYLVESARLPEVERVVGGFFARDRNGHANDGYVVYSIYFDSPDYRFYGEKREGELVRIKPRIRVYRAYEKSAPTAIFLELKGRYDRIIAKRRVAISTDTAERLLRPGPLDLTARALENSVMAEFYYLAQRFALRPCVSVIYHRTAFNGVLQDGLRMTFDRRVRSSLMTTLSNPEESFIEALPPLSSIIELKYNDRISGLLLDKFHSMGLHQHTLSKFGISMEQTHERFRQYLGMA